VTDYDYDYDNGDSALFSAVSAVTPRVNAAGSAPGYYAGYYGILRDITVTVH